jgi:hypothetical protein
LFSTTDNVKDIKPAGSLHSARRNISALKL